MLTSPIFLNINIFFFFWITSDNQLPFGSTAMTTHRYIGLVNSIRLVHTAAQKCTSRNNESRKTLQDLRFFCVLARKWKTWNDKAMWELNSDFSGWNFFCLYLNWKVTLHSSCACIHVHQQRQQVSTTVSRVRMKQNTCEQANISRVLYEGWNSSRKGCDQSTGNRRVGSVSVTQPDWRMAGGALSEWTVKDTVSHLRTDRRRERSP